MTYRKFKTSLLLGAIASGAFAIPAMAQEAETGRGDEILVTARRVEERLQDVPISISVLNQEQLTQRNISVPTDLALYTPSLTTNQRYGPEKASFSIRGFGQDLSTAPTVGIYFADVIGLRAQGGITTGNSVGAGAFTDLENVQVLKGPQGTLFGRNTTGGAVLLSPKRPTDRFEGFIEGTYGNFDQMRLTGVVNIPLADTFAIRASVERNQRDGYMRNLSGVGPKAYNDVDYTYARLGILAQLTPTLENYTLFHYSKSQTNGYASRIIGCPTPASEFPLNETVGTPGYSGTRHLTAASCALQLARQNARGDSLYDVEGSNASQFLDLTQWQVINTTTWEASDNLTVKNIVSYGEFEERTDYETYTGYFTAPGLDPSPTAGDTRLGFLLTRISPRLTATGAPGGTPLFVAAGTPYQRLRLDTPYPHGANANQSTFTEELQLQGKALDGKLNYVIGGYLEFSRPIGFNAGRTGVFLDCVEPQDYQCANPLRFGNMSESATRLSFDNHGIFAQGDYDLTDRLSVTAGIRYTFDKIVGVSQGTRANLSAPGRPNAFQEVRTGAWLTRNCIDSFRYGTGPVQDQVQCRTRLTAKSNEPTWLLGVDYKASDDLLVYAKYARGYRQGGMNFTNPGVEVWHPEKLDNYELGVKASFRGAVSGYFNVAAFYNDLTDAQFYVGLTPTPAQAATGLAGGAAIFNAGAARSYGVEVDATALLFDRLSLSLGYTYLNTKVTEVATAAEILPLLDGTPFGEARPRVVKGSPFIDSPKHRLTLSAAYTLPLDEALGRIVLGATFVHTSKALNDASVPAYVNGIGLGVTEASDLLNLNLDWKSVAGSPIDLGLFATNSTKEKFNIANMGDWATFGSGSIQLNPPRMFGVRVRFNFGN